MALQDNAIRRRRCRPTATVCYSISMYFMRNRIPQRVVIYLTVANTMKTSNPIYGYGVGDGGLVSDIGIGLHQSASTDSHGDCH